MADVGVWGNQNIYKRKSQLMTCALTLAILFVLIYSAAAFNIVQLAPVLKGMFFGVVVLWAMFTGRVLSQAMSARLPPQVSHHDYMKLKNENETLKMNYSELRKEYDDLKRSYMELSNRNQTLSDQLAYLSILISSKEQELNLLRNELEALRRRMDLELGAPDLAEWRRNVIEKANLVGRDYTIIYMLLKQADDLARSGNRAGARAILQAAYNLLQDRLVDRKLILLWEIGERPPADLQGTFRG